LNFVGRLFRRRQRLTAEHVRRTAGTNLRICCTRQDHAGPESAGEIRRALRAAASTIASASMTAGPDQGTIISRCAARHPRRAGGRARAQVGHLVKIEIEVDTLAQLREVLDTGLADVVLLDNMDIATLTEAVQIARGRVVDWKPPAASRWTRLHRSH